MTTIGWETELDERPVRVTVILRFYGRSNEDVDIEGLDIEAIDTGEKITHLLTDKDRQWLIADAMDRHFAHLGGS